MANKVYSNSNLIHALVDSGATHHIGGNKALFQSFTGKSMPVQVADRHLPTEAREGQFYPNDLGLVTGLFHPAFDDLLISVPQFQPALFSEAD